MKVIIACFVSLLLICLIMAMYPEESKDVDDIGSSMDI